MERTIMNRERSAPAGRLENSCGERWRRNTATQWASDRGRRAFSSRGLGTGTTLNRRIYINEGSILTAGGAARNRQKAPRRELFDGEGLGAVFVDELQHLA